MSKHIYKYRSLFALPCLRRLFYKNGHGIHSPLAYYLVSQVVSCKHCYYAYQLMSYSFPQPQERKKRLGQLLFRLIAPVGEDRFSYYIEKTDVAMAAWGMEACRRGRHLIVCPSEDQSALQEQLSSHLNQQSHSGVFHYSHLEDELPPRSAVCYCSNPDLALRYLSSPEEDPERRRNILIAKIRKDPASYAKWKEIATQNEEAKIVIDLYHCGIVVTGPRLPHQVFRAYMK